MANSVDPDPVLGIRCLLLYLIRQGIMLGYYLQQTTSTDIIGALRVKNKKH